MLKDEYKVYEEKMKKSIESVKNDFAAVRAGRANASVLDRIMVDYYGSPTPIQQIAAISSPDARTLLISPWDKTAVKSIEKAIQKSAGDKTVNPIIDKIDVMYQPGHINATHAETTAVRLAERLRADYPALEVTHRGDTVELRGRGLRERQATEAGLRWLGR